MSVVLTVYGPPRTKKNSQRILKRGEKRWISQSPQAKAWEESAVTQLRARWRRRRPIDRPARMSAAVYRYADTGDLLNYLAAVSDALERAGVIANDRLIVSLDGCCMHVDRGNPRVVIELSPVLPAQGA